MPTYQYACNACKHEFEVFQAFTDSSLTHCPECSGELRKVYSAVGVVFKGSGFYKTDSKSDSKSSSESKSKSGSKSSSESKSESNSGTSAESDSKVASSSATDKPAAPAAPKPSAPATNSNP